MGLNSNVLDKTVWPSQSGLRMGAINICSIKNKIDELSALLYNFGSYIHVFGVSETMCKKIHKDQIEIKNYLPEHIWAASCTDKIMNRVGLTVYIHNDIVQ